MVVRKFIPTGKRIASSWPKEPFDAIKKIDSQNFQSWVECSLKYLVWSFGLVWSFDLVRSFDFVWSFDLPVHVSVAQGGICLFSLKDFPFVLVIDLLYFPLDVVEDALAQGANGLGLMNNEDHQVLRNEQKLEEDASDCTRVDDDGVGFSPEGGDYFPTMGDETKKDKCSIFLLLLIICIVLMLMDRALYGAGLDELKHDLSTKESVAQKSASESSYFVLGANIKPNKADPEEVADLDLDQLPTSASIVLVSSITGLMTPDLVCPSTYQLLRSSSGDSGPDVSFDMSASPEHLSYSARARLATSTLSVAEPASDMLPYPFAHARFGSVSLLRCTPLVLHHGMRLASVLPYF
ncbi:hypothetical protein Tco_0098683 [Tanacetum coccineum]